MQAQSVIRTTVPIPRRNISHTKCCPSIGPPDAFGSVDLRSGALEPVHAESPRHIELLLLPTCKGLKRRIIQQPHDAAIRLFVPVKSSTHLLENGTSYSVLPYLEVHEELRSGQLSAAPVGGMNPTCHSRLDQYRNTLSSRVASGRCNHPQQACLPCSTG